MSERRARKELRAAVQGAQVNHVGSEGGPCRRHERSAQGHKRAAQGGVSGPRRGTNRLHRGHMRVMQGVR